MRRGSQAPWTTRYFPLEWTVTMFQRVNRLFQDGGNRTGVEESMKNPIGLHIIPARGMVQKARVRHTPSFLERHTAALLPQPFLNSYDRKMRQVAGYFVNYFDSRAIMDQLQIPDKGVDEIMLKFPINDWLAKTKRHNIVCTTVGHVYSGYKEAEGAFLITQIKISRGRQSQNIEPLYERDQDKYVKRWLVEEGGAKEEGLQWMSFPDGDKLYLLVDGIRPERNDFKGPWFHYQFTNDQNRRLTSSGKGMGEWVAEATANGEVVERIWPPQEHPSPP